jgi:competence protein ComEC
LSLPGAGGHSPAPGASFRRPLLPLLAAFAAGIALAPRLPPGLAGYPLYLLAAAIALCLVLSARRPAASFLPAAALLMVAGIAAAQATLRPALPANHLSRLHGRQLLLEGRVLAAEELAGGSHRLLVDVLEARGSRLLPVSGRLLVRAWGEGECPEPGSPIRFPARPQPVRGYANPGCYDLQRRLAAEGIFSRASVKLTSISRLGRSDAPLLAALRHRVARFIRERVEGPAGGLCLALALGTRSGLPAEAQEAFARTGAAHLLCVSGLHLGLVGLLAYSLFRRLVSRSERLLLRVPAQHLAAALAFAVVLLYALLVGWRAPAVRAAIMVGAALLVLLAASASPAGGFKPCALCPEC